MENYCYDWFEKTLFLHFPKLLYLIEFIALPYLAFRIGKKNTNGIFVKFIKFIGLAFGLNILALGIFILIAGVLIIIGCPGVRAGLSAPSGGHGLIPGDFWSVISLGLMLSALVTTLGTVVTFISLYVGSFVESRRH